MFETRLIDTFSRTHWSAVPILYVPAAVICVYFAVTRDGLGLPSLIASALLGLLGWTLVEYWAHRKLFHWEPPGKLGERMHFVLHGVHHKWPRDRYRLVFPPAASLSLFFLFVFLFRALFGRYAYASLSGFTVGYMLYDLSHYYIHHGRSQYEWMRKLRKHHMVHHSPKLEHEKKFGVSTTLWDHAFGTYVEE
jgi:sterol desaturase/sphingolipid hydroxylase (fatty acid hydroxylase superfamily)